ncbi:MAG: glycoside hydrolase family 2 protein [Ferruginibacter sp.]|nr:glycoside hydrolase family 2 protein [Ferruginibacter sp.]
MKKLLTIAGMFCMGLLTGQSIKLDLNRNWEFRKKGDTEWMKASVPGTVHTDLLAGNKIKDPFYRTNEKDQQWIETTDWEYRSDFTVNDNMLANEKIEVIFEGLDTYADVFMNGTKIIAADNMFLLWKADIKKHLKKGANQLLIIFYSPITRVLPVYDSLRYKVPVSNNDQAEKRVSVFTRKAGYHYGWDWGPRFVTSGIWRPAYIHAWSNTRIEDLFIKQLQLTENTASLEAQVTATSTGQGIKTLQIFVNNNSKPVLTKEVMVLTGDNQLNARFTINNIKLWWPNGMGAQYMYQLKAVLSDKNGAVASREVKQGLRTIELVNETNAKGKSFYFKVNGKAVFIKGANYIPQDNFLPRVSRERYEHVINTAASSHMNMLRVWGGGIYENDLFYQLCDEKGILVWQDFMFACAMFPPFESLRKNIQAEAAYNVKRLRNHPSIALWCGNNEIGQFMNEKFWGHSTDNFKTPADSASIYNMYADIFHNILPAAVKAYDDEKYYWSSSPSNENFSMNFNFTLLTGDVHYWGVWWGKQPFEKYNEVVGPFMSEYGFQSFPEFETVKQYTIPADHDINGEVMNAHQRSTIGNGTITHYMKDMFNVPASFENFLYVGQVLQAEGIKIAIEAHRRAKPFCMGTLFWQMDDCWPVASWSSMDYYGRWKAQQYMAKRAYADFCISPVKENDSIKIFAVSDLYKKLKAIVQVSLVGFDGRVLKKISKEVAIPENSSTMVYALKEEQWVSATNRKNVVLKMKLIIDNVEVAENKYYFEKPKDLELPAVKISIKQTGANTIELLSDKMARSVWLFLPGTDNAFSDNYFDLLPGEKKQLQVKSNNLKKIMGNIRIKTLVDAGK